MSVLLACLPWAVQAQKTTTTRQSATIGESTVVPQSKNSSADKELPVVVAPADTTFSAQDSLKFNNILKLSNKKNKRDWSTWRPDIKRAMWLAIVLPGAGQIYNRKYWKLPIIYGGFVGCAYAITWNNQMYHDYSQAYMDIMDDDPTTDSYNQFLHLGATIDASNMDRYKEIFRKRKDRYRRWRDMGVFVMIGVYAFSIIDAYVDASLSEFDISDDLTLRVDPAFMNCYPQSRNPFRSSTLGIQCSLTF